MHNVIQKIVKQIAIKKQYDVVIDSPEGKQCSLIVYTNSSVSITNLVLQRLNKKMSSIAMNFITE